LKDSEKRKEYYRDLNRTVFSSSFYRMLEKREKPQRHQEILPKQPFALGEAKCTMPKNLWN
jgi:hypothetical protein